MSGFLTTSTGATPVSFQLHDAGGGVWVIDSLTVADRPVL
jgi:hypothetical protein